MAEARAPGLGADVAVAVTGVAGPGGGGTEEEARSGSSTSMPPGRRASGEGQFNVPSDRETIRRRSAVAALHLVRRLLTQSRHEYE
jgi:nicotinamide-nucleotide amidase